MVKRRDRHGRGIRGPLAPAGTAGRSPRLPGATTNAEAFHQAVSDAVARVQVTCPEALAGVEVGTEDVPGSHAAGGGVPLAAATEATSVFPARVVIYRRPLEHRSATRRGLRILVHRTLVEQLSALTGRSVADIDPQVPEDDD